MLRDGRIDIVSTGSGSSKTIEGLPAAASAISVAPDGALVFVAEPAGVRVFDSDGTEAGTVAIAGASDLALSRDGARLYVAGTVGVSVVATNDLTVERVAAMGADRPLGLALSPDGSLLLAAAAQEGFNPSAYLFDTVSMEQLARVFLVWNAPCAASPSDAAFAAQKTAVLWDPACDLFFRIDVSAYTQSGSDVPAPFEAAVPENANNALAAVGGRVFAPRESGTVIAFSTTGGTIESISGWSGTPYALAASTDGEALWVAGDRLVDRLAPAAGTIETAVIDLGTVGSARALLAVDAPPVIEPIPDVRVDEGEAVSFRVQAQDPDGDAVTLSAGRLPAGAVFDPDSGVFRWTPAEDQSGEYQVTFVARSTFQSDTEDVTIRVGGASAGGDHGGGCSVRFGALGSLVSLGVALCAIRQCQRPTG